MIVVKTNNKLGNLCNACTQNYPECKSKNVVFGDGVGRDNIIVCDGYTDAIGIYDTNSENPNTIIGTVDVVDIPNIIEYNFSYGIGGPHVTIRIDHDKFTPEMAMTIMDFHGWIYEDDATVVMDFMVVIVLKTMEYMMLTSSTAEDIPSINAERLKNNLKRWLSDTYRGIPIMDGTEGIEIMDAKPYEFLRHRLNHSRLLILPEDES